MHIYFKIKETINIAYSFYPKIFTLCSRLKKQIEKNNL